MFLVMWQKYPLTKLIIFYIWLLSTTYSGIIEVRTSLEGSLRAKIINFLIFWNGRLKEMTRRVVRNFYFFSTSKTWWHPEKIGHGFASWWSILPPSFYATDFVKLISFIKVIQRFCLPFLHRLCKFIVFYWKKISESL